MGMLWGPSRDLDYWTARAADLISPEERRAMALLASISDETRFSFYCQTGQMPAMGNATKRIYLIRRYDRVLELEDGRPYKSWCIGASDRYAIPETDHVVTMKTLIEGEELAFRETGNPSEARFFVVRDDGMRNPYTTPFYAGDEARKYENEDIADFMDVKRAMDGMRSVYEFKKKAWDQVIREGPPELEDLLGLRRKIPHNKAKIGFGNGTFVGGASGQYQQFPAGYAGTVPTQFNFIPGGNDNATAGRTNGVVIGGGFFINNSTNLIT